jgi:hypothetical protein
MKLVGVPSVTHEDNDVKGMMEARAYETFTKENGSI